MKKKKKRKNNIITWLCSFFDIYVSLLWCSQDCLTETKAWPWHWTHLLLFRQLLIDPTSLAPNCNPHPNCNGRLDKWAISQTHGQFVPRWNYKDQGTTKTRGTGTKAQPRQAVPHQTILESKKCKMNKIINWLYLPVICTLKTCFSQRHQL